MPNKPFLTMLDFGHLVSEGLVIEKFHPTLPLVMYKYHNQVFYKNLWHIDDLLCEARGIVFHTETGEVVQRPIHKCFNVGENGTELPDNCEAYRKVNGYMCAATATPDHEVLVTTTGSFNSDYQKLAESWVSTLTLLNEYLSYHYTLTFEICDPSDPHIVEEEYGIYLLAMRDKVTGMYTSQTFCDLVAEVFGCKRPRKDEYDLSAKHEGWMFYRHDGTPITKMKTPHYLSKKALMRLGKKQIHNMYHNREEFIKRLDEEFYQVYNFLIDEYSEEEYSALNEQQRRQVIEEYFYGA